MSTQYSVLTESSIRVGLKVIVVLEILVSDHHTAQTDVDY
jgi:hypothetical protein